MKRLTFALTALFAATLSADPLTDVRGALARFPAKQPIRATYELQRNVKQEGKFQNEKYDAKVAVELEADADTVRVAYARPLLDQAVRENRAEARDSKLATPTASTLGQVEVMSVVELLDFAPALLQMLDGAQVKEDRAGTWQGKPARILVLKLRDPKPETEAGKVTVLENRLTLWLAADHAPLAAEHLYGAKFSFLIFKGESRSKRSWHIAHVNDRLVAARHEITETGSGMGQKGNEASVSTLRVH